MNILILYKFKLSKALVDKNQNFKQIGSLDNLSLNRFIYIKIFFLNKFYTSNDTFYKLLILSIDIVNKKNVHYYNM